MPTLFISYSSKDRHFAERLASDLKRRGINIWLDKWEIKVGDSIINKIEKGIRDNDFLGIVISQNSILSDWVKKELNAALIKELKKKSVVVLPLLIENCDIPILISDKKYADFRYNYEQGLNELLEKLKPETNVKKAIVDNAINNEEIKSCWNIFNNPYTSDYARDAAFERLIQLKAFNKLKIIVNNVWTSEEYKGKALRELSNYPKGSEDFLYSIITRAFTSHSYQEIALEGLLNAKSKKYLLKLIEGGFTPEWIKMRASKAIKESK